MRKRLESAGAPTKRKDSIAEILLMKHLQELDLTFDREFRFHAARKWRFDFTVTGHGPQTAIEIEGGLWVRGRHNRALGFEADARKYNEAVKLGWRILRFSPNMIERAEDKVFLAELFGRGA